MTDNENLTFIILGSIICLGSIAGMWEHLPEALMSPYHWQARDAILWRLSFYAGIVIVFINLWSLYKKRKENDKNT